MEKSFNTRAYNSIELLPFGLVRKSSSSDRLFDEVSYYESVPSSIIHLFPRKTGYCFQQGKHNLMLEYYPYKNLGQYMILNDAFDWSTVFENLKDCLEVMSGITEHSEDSPSYAVSMYITKTKTEYENFKTSYEDTELFSCDTLIINGKPYDNFEKLWHSVRCIIEQNLLNYRRTMIHGDMCFSNILYEPVVGARFIDMRGSFGAKGIYGDPLYDYAKLLHSVEGGYEFIINDRFSVDKQSTGVYDASVFCNKNKDLALDAYLSAFNHKNIHFVRLVEGLIFVGMCARHYDCSKRQLMMYLTGIKTLNEAVKELC